MLWQRSVLARIRTRMKLGLILRTVALALLCQFISGCSTQSNTKAKHGHWVTLPPATGSMIGRTVWVEDNGDVNGPADAGNVQNTSPAALERLQRTQSSRRPGGF